MNKIEATEQFQKNLTEIAEHLARIKELELENLKLITILNSEPGKTPVTRTKMFLSIKEKTYRNRLLQHGRIEYVEDILDMAVKVSGNRVLTASGVSVANGVGIKDWKEMCRIAKEEGIKHPTIDMILNA